MLKFNKQGERYIKVLRQEDEHIAALYYQAYEINKWGIDSISSRATPDDIRQIAAKLLELNGGNTLQFIEQDDGVINIKHESGDAIGDLVKRDGMYRLTFLYTYDNADGLYQIADKLAELNKK